MRIYKPLTFLTLLVLLIGMLALPQPVLAQTGTGGDQVIFGTNFTLAEGETLEGNLIIFSGSATLEKGSTVNGDVVIFGGTLDASGVINGGVTSFGGTVNINETAIINQDINIVGGVLNKIGQVKGMVNEGPGQVLSVDFIDRLHLTRLWVRPNPTDQLLWMTVRCLAIAALAAIAALFLPKQTGRISRSITNHAVITGGIGCLSMIVFPALLLVMAITIILLPISAIGLLVFASACVFGWIGLGTAVGETFFNFIKVELPTPLSAGIGTFILSVIVDLVGWGTSLFFLFICCIGFPFFLAVLAIALGGIVTTVFGTRDFIPGKPRSTPPPYPPFMPPQPPAASPQPTSPQGDEPIPPTS